MHFESLLERVRASMHGVESSEAQTLGLDTPLPKAAQDALAQEIRDSHCGHAPEAMLAPMIAAQSFKDAWMAQELQEARPPAALIAGRGHVRNDRAVPRYLAEPEKALAIALVETVAGKSEPADYDRAGFDVLWFTEPGEVRPDPCATPLPGLAAPAAATPVAPSTTSPNPKP